MSITVTKIFFPPMDEVQRYLDDIWNRGWITNDGPLVRELELKLKERLGVDQLLCLSNGTIALQIAIRALNLQGEIITTPFSHVATTSSIAWERCQPVMVDICPETLNVDPAKIEKAITSKTAAILMTHVFGNPCDVDAIDVIAKAHGLPVIYDASHAFGTTHRNKSLLSYGDIATCSFHATKVFHMVEGGAVVTTDEKLLDRMKKMRNFGHSSPTHFDGIGINGKNSELHAAIGLCNLKYVEKLIKARRQLYQTYKAELKHPGITFQQITSDTQYNYAYFPIIFESEAMLLKVLELLNLEDIHPRRYFYPALSELSYVIGQKAPIAEQISRRILCLPLYHTLSDKEQDMICRHIRQAIKK